jgi:hypothetical protein
MFDYVLLQFQRLRSERRYRLAKNRLYRQRDYWQWLAEGKPAAVPHIVKQMAVKEHARRFDTRIFIETGTYLGEMVDAVQPLFSRVYSIELADRFFREARHYFRSLPHVTIVHGDSGSRLPELLSSVNEPALFWLDGHYSGGDTGQGKQDTPIVAELRAILEHPVKSHVILIDDARCFTGAAGYPALRTVFDLVQPKERGLRMEVRDDIIRIFPDIDPLETFPRPVR